MQEPLQISFHNMDHSDPLEARVRERMSKLERYHNNIIGCRIALEAPHKQPHKSTLGVSINLRVRGKDIVVKREARLHEAHEDAYRAVNEAFDVAERQLEEYARVQRRDVKAREAGRAYARVVSLYPDQDYGFIETPEHLNVYFHRAVVRDERFDELKEGSEVLYTIADEEGAMGPMASTIQLVRGEHPVR